tara:strand:- start:6 stop:422 length:417 start_codon:yes stop_codon:yes gene_type:complete
MENLFLLPAILFPAIPLMMVNFGNRYSSLSGLIRKLHDELIDKEVSKTDAFAERSLAQIAIFKRRLSLNRMMQILAILSFLVNLISIFFVFLFPLYFLGIFLFGVFLFAISISLYIVELRLAVRALDKHLEDLQDLYY